MRRLKKSHPARWRIDRSRVPSEGVYDFECIRIQTDELWRACELLYPIEGKEITREILSACGLEGAVALWLDRGSIQGRKGTIRGPYSPEVMELFAEWFTELGFPAECQKVNQYKELRMVVLKRESLLAWIKAARPLTHASVKHRLRGVSCVG